MKKPFIQIRCAFLHSSVNIPGEMPELTSITPEKAPKIKMTLVPQGLCLQGKTKTALVPLANVKLMEIASDDAESFGDKAA